MRSEDAARQSSGVDYEPISRVSIVRRWLRALRWLLGLGLMLLLVAVIAAEAFAWLFPQRLTEDEPWYVRFAAASMFIRVFQHYVGAATLGLALLLLATRWRRSAFIAAVVAVALLTPYLRDYAPKNPPKPTSPTFRLMSMNLYYMNRDEAAIMRAIDEADPDVIVMVEVTGWSMGNIIGKHLQERYHYVDPQRLEGTGLVLSRLPARLGKAVERDGAAPGRRPVIVDAPGGSVAIYAVHLISPGRSRLVERNREQVTMLTDIARVETRPMIVAGDCNFSQLTPNAAAMRRAGLRSTHELAGFGLGNTWGPRWHPLLNQLPGVRIDHIWLSPMLTATSHHVGPDTGSDHRPIVADIGLTAQK